jgi:hypothetical protein
MRVQQQSRCKKPTACCRMHVKMMQKKRVIPVLIQKHPAGPGAEYLREKNSSGYSKVICSFILQEESFSDCSQSSDSSESCSEFEFSSDFSATSASDFHHCSRMSMLHKLGPALNQVKDELRQIGPILSQLMAQIRKFARY